MNNNSEFKTEDKKVEQSQQQDNEQPTPQTPAATSPQQEEEKKNITIFDIFPLDTLTPTGGDKYKTTCPNCGLQGSRTEGFILFPDTDTAHCHSSHKWFRILEAYALKKGIIRCLDGRDQGDSKKKVLAGELWTLVLEEFKSDYGPEKFNQLLDQLNVRRSIELPGNNKLVSDFCDELADIYKSRNVLFYRGETGDVIEIEKNKKVGDDGIIHIERGFKKVDSDSFVSHAEFYMKPWTKIQTRNGLMKVGKSMTQSHANLTLASDRFKKLLPVLTRILDIQIPFMFKGKLTFPKKGYDSRFGTWLPYLSPQIKINMYTVQEAKTLINSIFEEFCFESNKDKTHALAAFITPFIRGLFKEYNTRTPIFIYMANRERAGKDYCAGCTGILYEGIDVQQPPISNDEKGSTNANEEIRKKLTACFMQGKKRFHSSNNKGLMNNSVFEMVTTSPVWQDRVLGKSTVVTYDNIMDYSLSGNLGIRLTPDLANRSRIINLHLMDEDANARIFKNPKLHEWVFDNRQLIISALYTLVKNWFDTGMKPGPIPFASFPEWARIVGGIMEAAGCDSPCDKDDSVMVSLDGDTEEMKDLFESCYKKHPDKWITKEDIRRVIEEEGIMHDYNFDSKADQIKFGIKIDKYINRMLSGIHMSVYSKTERASRRKYMFIKQDNLNRNLNRKTLDKKDYADVNLNFALKESQNPVNANFSPQSDHIYVLNYNNNFEKIFGNVCNLGNVHITSPEAYRDIYKYYTNLTKSTNITKNDNINLTNDNLNEKFALIGSSKKLAENSVERLIKKGKDYLKKEEESSRPKPREKTDREIQFWEAPECKGIVAQCTEEQTLEWIKANPNVCYEQMRPTLGLGCSKHIVSLINKGSVRRTDLGWEVI